MPPRRRSNTPKCPECETTREVTHRVTVPGKSPREVCHYCSTGYEHVPGAYIERLASRLWCLVVAPLGCAQIEPDPFAEWVQRFVTPTVGDRVDEAQSLPTA